MTYKLLVKKCHLAVNIILLTPVVIILYRIFAPLSFCGLVLINGEVKWVVVVN